jgi:hypothetical protein
MSRSSCSPAGLRPHLLAAAISALGLAGCAATTPVARAPETPSDAPVVVAPAEPVTPAPAPIETPAPPAQAAPEPAPPTVVAESTQATGR